MHSYQKHIGDYRRDTTHLSLLEHGVYNALLDWSYLDELPIPRKTEVVFRRLRAVTEEEQKAVLVVLEEFFTDTEAGWVHGRVQAEIAAYAARADRARTNGKSGGRKKGFEKSSGYGGLPTPPMPPNTPKPSGNPVGFSGLSEETQKITNQEPITNINDNNLARARAVETTIPDDLSVDSFRQWAQAQGITELDAHFNAFAEKCRTERYTYSNWDRATKTAIVNSWSKANSRAPPSQPSSSTPGISGRSGQKPRKKIEVDKDGRIL